METAILVKKFSLVKTGIQKTGSFLGKSGFKLVYSKCHLRQKIPTKRCVAAHKTVR